MYVSSLKSTWLATFSLTFPLDHFCSQQTNTQPTQKTREKRSCKGIDRIMRVPTAKAIYTCDEKPPSPCSPQKPTTNITPKTLSQTYCVVTDFTHTNSWFRIPSMVTRQKRQKQRPPRRPFCNISFQSICRPYCQGLHTTPTPLHIVAQYGNFRSCMLGYTKRVRHVLSRQQHAGDTLSQSMAPEGSISAKKCSYRMSTASPIRGEAVVSGDNNQYRK